ncbi:phospho-N-acetylmuramoyl-pentapeptide-transferase [Priestia taiwanensis]|uniref:Phospho-N-acetylmuramoyl-pentapeptide-transferase n=1 Tax=Priestia taiwanensis TaxID=1347902 RepID=A0A917EM88_9BACI|nr:phospho-N-acetylmuramoyl-pentapeptide-transferase [Priestia taiwanensis]MBM7362453.1 phospho-N-acetylmuramoyl-pentapeptide-transferase [Priestia taiwanensis]GGE62324.1 phospho-N-acetylmuramoyl-pentapeptide-transferase [Priestia taiwanensis]
MYTVFNPGIFSFLLVTLITPFVIFFFKKMNVIQPIRKELPPDHQQKKGTPLMVGIVFYIGVFVALFYSTSNFMLLLCAIFVAFGFIGFLDDSWKAVKKDPGGVSGKTKLIFQFIFTFIFLFFLIHYFEFDATIHITKEFSIIMPLFLYVPLISLFIVGSANAINFTDGMDGLLTNVAIPTFIFFFLTSSHIEIQILSIALVGCLLGFFIFNIYPAKGFMGDTGSLAIGGILVFFSVIEHVEILVPLLFIIYFAEQFSVIIQVYFYKMTGKRIFRMSPIHYHFSIKYGWSENKIVTIFGFISWLGCGLAYVYWYLFM